MPMSLVLPLSIPFMLFLSVLASLLFFLIPMWLIFKRVGLYPAWSLLSLIPLIGFLIILIMLAFGDWPNQIMPYPPQEQSS